MKNRSYVGGVPDTFMDLVLTECGLFVRHEQKHGPGGVSFFLIRFGFGCVVKCYE